MGINAKSVIFRIGAWLCLLIGVFSVWVTAAYIFPPQSPAALPAIIFVTYTILAFFPFMAFVYPKWATRRKLVFWTAAAIELAVLVFFILNITATI